MKYFLLGIAIMAFATYIPRVIPMIFCRKPIKSAFWKSFLYYMPYAVLAALTFPAILYSTGNIYIAAICAAVALVLSFFNLNITLVAIICVAIAFGLGFVF